MKKITLDNGMFALVGDIDFISLSEYQWYAREKRPGIWYAARHKKIDGKMREIFMHREILGLKRGDGLQSDHIDQNGLNNQRNNLRICTGVGNMKNRGSQKNSSSKYKGVSYYRKSNKWMAQIVSDGKFYYLGLHPTEVAAALKYNEAAKRLHGDFAFLNKIELKNQEK